jgi:hypothetical protein
VAHTINFNPPAPMSKLRESGVIEQRSLSSLDQEVWFLNWAATSHENYVGFDSMFGAINDDLMALHWLKNIHLNRTDMISFGSIWVGTT